MNLYVRFLQPEKKQLSLNNSNVLMTCIVLLCRTKLLPELKLDLITQHLIHWGRDYFSKFFSLVKSTILHIPYIAQMGPLCLSASKTKNSGEQSRAIISLFSLESRPQNSESKQS